MIFSRELGRGMHDVGGITPVARLFHDHAVPRGGILAHMNCLADSDYKLLASYARDIAVVHCPKCHEYFGRPPFELDRFRSIGISVCLGTDSLASNTSLNLFEEMRHLRRNFPHISSRKSSIWSRGAQHGPLACRVSWEKSPPAPTPT